MPTMPRPRGSLTPEQESSIAAGAALKTEGDAAYRAAVLSALADGASFAEVAAFTGLSTNTLQRWKREAR